MNTCIDTLRAVLGAEEIDPNTPMRRICRTCRQSPTDKAGIGSRGYCVPCEKRDRRRG